MLTALLVVVILLAAPIAGLVAYTAIHARRAERLVPRRGRLLDVAGGRIHYVDEGKGPTVLLVHGLGAQLNNFSYALIERLRTDHRVIAIDRPGAGYSTATGAHPDLSAQAAIVADVIRALDLDRPLLVGHSLGGAIALALALEQPRLIRGLALIAPLTQPVEGEPPAAFRALMLPSPFVRRVVAWTLATPLGRRNRIKGLTLVFGPEPIPDDYDDLGGGALALRPRSFIAASSEVSLGSQPLIAQAARYAGLGLPTAILFGRGDRILDPAIHGGRLEAVVPGATLELIDGGHMIPLTRPDQTADWLRRFDRRVAGAQA